MSEPISHQSNKQVARVVAEHKVSYVIRIGSGPDRQELSASVRGKFHKGVGAAAGDDASSIGFPKVGDLVEYSKTPDGQAIIESVLPRRTEIVRDTADRNRRSVVERPQVMAANVDIAFIVMGLDGDFNLSRLDRYLVLARQSRVMPVIVLNKSDMLADPAARADCEAQVSAIAGGAPIHFVSAKTGEGMDALRRYFESASPSAIGAAADLSADAAGNQSGPTAVLIGSSGAGKSTITNLLLLDGRQKTGEVRADDSRGKHTTTSRELFDLPHGGCLIDTPGIRGLGLMGSDEAAASGEADTFADIEALIPQCRYSRCDHNKSQGCAIQVAIADGTLEERRFQSYLKLTRERERASAHIARSANRVSAQKKGKPRGSAAGRSASSRGAWDGQDD